mmetsp:Transcript_21517/g.31857  ORF Transcript_21517/g.31857 Transcript_21517/m.31857 type:complete len:194 (+) Transcript_21517:56-637(+)
MSRIAYISLIFVLAASCMMAPISSFSLTMMGTRRGKGGMKITDGSSKKLTSEKSKISSLNNGRGQEITGVTLPAEGNVKGWEFGERERIACANVDGTFYAIQGGCPRCAFDLYKGDLITDESFEDLPRLACPTCSTTFSLKNGFYGPALKRTGLAGFVANLSKTATINDAMVNAKAFVITREEDTGRVFMREK